MFSKTYGVLESPLCLCVSISGSVSLSLSLAQFFDSSFSTSSFPLPSLPAPSEPYTQYPVKCLSLWSQGSTSPLQSDRMWTLFLEVDNSITITLMATMNVCISQQPLRAHPEAHPRPSFQGQQQNQLENSPPLSTQKTNHIGNISRAISSSFHLHRDKRMEAFSEQLSICG